MESRIVLAADVAVFAFDAPIRNSLIEHPASVTAFESSDINGDGLLDILIAGVEPVFSEAIEPALDQSEPIVAESDPNEPSPGGPDSAEVNSGESNTVEEPDADKTTPEATDTEPPATEPTDVNATQTVNTPYLKVFLATSEKTFADGIPVLLDASASEIATITAADMNSDGLTDIVSQTFAGDVSIFSAVLIDEAEADSESVPSPSYEQSFTENFDGHLFAAGDFNGDGLADVMTRSDTEAVIHLQVPTESDAAVSFLNADPYIGNIISVEDVDSDSDLDLIGVCRFDCVHTDQLMVAINNGQGQFLESVALAPVEVGATVASVQFHDLTDNGVGDLLLGVDSENGSQIQIWSRQLDGVVSLHDAIDVDGSIESVHVVNSETPLADIIVGHTVVERGHTFSDASVFKSAAAGDLATEYVSYPLPLIDARITSVADGGGVTAFNASVGEMVSLSATLSPKFEDVAVDYELAMDGRSASIFDLNNDGILDILGKTTTGLEFAIGDSNGEFAIHSIDLENLASFQMYVDNFDANPGQDLVVVGTEETNGPAIVLRIDTYGTTPSIANTFVTEPGIVLETDDLNADGLTDFVFRSDFLATDKQSFALLNRSEEWHTSSLSTESATIAVEDLDGDGTLEAYVFEDPIRIFKYVDGDYIDWGGVPKGTTRANVLDFNGDGLRDFLSINKKSNEGTTLSVFANVGDGTWAEWDAVPANSHELVDVNGDGLIDITSPRHFFISNGDGTWTKTAELESTTPEWAERNQYIDLNGDGLIDDAKFHATTGRLTTHELQKDNTWVVHEHEPLGGFDFELIDLNGDGLTDLIDANGDSVTVSLRVDDGWSELQHLSTEAEHYVLVDYDLDSRLDVAIVGDDSVSYHLQDELGQFTLGETIETGQIEFQEINEDGIFDLKLLANDANESTMVMFGSEAGFMEPVAIPIQPIATEWFGASLQYVIGEGTTTQFITTSVVAPSPDANGYPTLVEDLNGDGEDDFLTLHPGGLLVLPGRSNVTPILGDFDQSGLLDIGDLELLRAAIDELESQDGQTLGDPLFDEFDLDRDGIVDDQDDSIWVKDIANTFYGDADLDGDVDFSDFLTFSLHFSDEDSTWSDGDFDGDGVVSFPDFLLLSREFGSPEDDEPEDPESVPPEQVEDPPAPVGDPAEPLPPVSDDKDSTEGDEEFRVDPDDSLDPSPIVGGETTDVAVVVEDETDEPSRRTRG